MLSVLDKANTSCCWRSYAWRSVSCSFGGQCSANSSDGPCGTADEHMHAGGINSMLDMSQDKDAR